MLKISSALKLIVILVVLFWLIIPGVCDELQTSPQAPKIPTEQQSEGSLKREEKTNQAKQKTINLPVITPTNQTKELKNDPQNNRQKSADEGAEFCIFSGYKFRITDLALVAFTFILSICTAGLWYVTRKAMISTQRAFVFLKDIEFKEISDRINPTTAHWQFFPHWENSGGTPTKNLTISVGCDKFTFDPNHKIHDDIELIYKTYKDIPLMIGPKAVVVSQPIELPETNVGALDFITKTYLRDTYKVYMWGEAKYHDIFWGTKQHVTRFCVELFFIEQPHGMIRIAPMMSFNYYKKYNYAD